MYQKLAQQMHGKWLSHVTEDRRNPCPLGNGWLWLVFLNNIYIFPIPFPCSSSWLEEDDDPVVGKVNQRMQQITGLTVKTAELLQVSTLGSYQDEI